MRGRPDVNRRLSLIFLDNETLAQLPADPILSAEEVVLNEAVREIRERLMKIVAVYQKRPDLLTDYQKVVLDGLLAGKTMREISITLGYTKNPHNHNHVVWQIINGFIRDPIIRHRVGGIYRKLRKGLLDDDVVRYLLYILQQVKEADYKAALTFLKTIDPDFWNDYDEEVL